MQDCMLPKRSDMSSFSGSRNPSSLTVSAEPVVVITCPACCTKFAVEGSAVTALDIPRFHCSRCDQIFLLDSPHTAESPASQLPKSENNNPRWVLSNPSKIIEDLQPSQDSASTPIEPEELSFGAPGWLPPSMQQQALRTPPIAPANIDLQPELLSMSSGISLLAQGRSNLEAHQPSGGFSPTPTRRAQVPQPPRAQHIENQPRMRPSAGQAI